MSRPVSNDLEMTGDMSSSDQLERPRFTASGIRRGSVEIAPIAAFVIPFGIAFGVAASTKGISPGISVFMSVVIDKATRCGHWLCCDVRTRKSDTGELID
jgi:hypothetical protein